MVSRGGGNAGMTAARAPGRAASRRSAPPGVARRRAMRERDGGREMPTRGPHDREQRQPALPRCLSSSAPSVGAALARWPMTRARMPRRPRGDAAPLDPPLSSATDAPGRPRPAARHRPRGSAPGREDEAWRVGIITPMIPVAAPLAYYGKPEFLRYGNELWVIPQNRTVGDIDPVVAASRAMAMCVTVYDPRVYCERTGRADACRSYTRRLGRTTGPREHHFPVAGSSHAD